MLWFGLFLCNVLFWYLSCLVVCLLASGDVSKPALQSPGSLQSPVSNQFPEETPNLAQDKGGPSKGGFLNNRLFSYTRIYICVMKLMVCCFPRRDSKPKKRLPREQGDAMCDIIVVDMELFMYGSWFIVEINCLFV